MNLLFPDWLAYLFVFAVGGCVGSFLNVVIYRIPKGKSLINPPSTCPSCQTRIRWFDNIPLLSWVALGAKCRKCKAKISPRYFIVELLTAAIFTGIFWFFFDSSLRCGVKISEGGLYLYLVTIIFISCLIASSGIDLELWIIPLSICWAGAVVGFIGSTAAPLFINPMIIRGYHLFPMATANTGAIAVGAFIGMLISLGILNLGWIKRSYEFDEGKELSPELIQQEYHDENISHRKEVLKEIVFLLPIILFSIGCYLAVNRIEGLRSWWINVMQVPAIAGLTGSLYGYFVGCAVVWTTRILGTLVFGKEAMGLGDVHLMGAAGAVVGPVLVTVAFFIAPFYGLGWAVFQLIFKKIRQIPYGPFLSLAILTVIILHDYIYGYICALFNG